MGTSRSTQRATRTQGSVGGGGGGIYNATWFLGRTVAYGPGQLVSL